MASNTQNFAN
ncbi:Putative uncharacterized protein [Lactococcus lactis subsp. lactis A12]|uniref:Uncharacterized protein n=1 Tax=Lactococcus lactis subsp. lactis A12 TaxID=1137134 RepID=S6F500_LACLL|nr:Putative uncharacterized protein [Lactococcus lactis subsp. lactis A12]SBW30956.1 Hypothetical protein LLA12_01807 [Lactococcus lactis subsp. lactis]